MCKKTTTMRRNIDPCLRKIIAFLNRKSIKTVSSCCGHGKYKPTIIIETRYKTYLEIFSGRYLNNHKRFYRRDKDGYYYLSLPEIWQIYGKNKNIKRIG